MDESTTNIAVCCVSALLLASYHSWLVWMIKNCTEQTVYGLSAHSRRAWVAAIMKGSNKDILAVQSLRNLIMASSILASTCVAIIFGFIAFLATVVSHPETVDTTGNPMGSQFGFVLDKLFGPKVMMLLIVFCVAFFCFAQSMRFYNHVGMVININLSAQELEECLNLGQNDNALPTTEQEPEKERNLTVEHPIQIDTDANRNALDMDSVSIRETNTTNTTTNNNNHARAILSRNQSSESILSLRRNTATSGSRRRQGSVPRHQQQQDMRDRQLKVHALASRIEFVARMLNRGSMFYTLGMRGYYISFPVMAYLWGPWALLGTTVLLVGILRVVDFNLEALSPVGSLEPFGDSVVKPHVVVGGGGGGGGGGGPALEKAVSSAMSLSSIKISP
ncbi:hypothetical protein BDR26DRAFT_916677 [Obelidium mucronatum]|nr:hypothetical protein BDR26DRAFT_916677 [Obelidium mucronatum]